MARKTNLEKAIEEVLVGVHFTEDPILRARGAGNVIQRFQNAVRDLADMRRDAIVAAVESGLSYSQVADQLDMTKSNVARIYADAVQRPDEDRDLISIISQDVRSQLGTFRPLLPRQ